MKPEFYRILDCENYLEINQDLLQYVKQYTTILNESNNYQYANFPENFGLDIKHFIAANPKFITWLKSMDLFLRDFYFTLTWHTETVGYPESSCPIHLDKPPVCWKLNWPIVNMERTSVRFFKLKDPGVDINTLVERAGDPASKDRDHYRLQYADFTEVERHDFALNQPILMNGQVPHDVGFYPDPVFPRVGLQGMFFKEPIHLI